MTERTIVTEEDRKYLALFLAAQKLPITVTIVKGKRRSIEQNKLQRLWLNEISDQLGDRTPEEIRGYCKLHFGVPILRNAHPEFKEKYDRLIRDLPYETKLEYMMVPIDFPVTRLMKTKQHSEYLDAIQKHFSAQGVVLTEPQK